MEDLEKRLLEILASDEDDALDDELESSSPDDQDEELIDALLKLELPSPDEIEKQVKIEKHNTRIENARREKLERRRARQKRELEIGKRRPKKKG